MESISEAHLIELAQAEPRSFVEVLGAERAADALSCEEAPQPFPPELPFPRLLSIVSTPDSRTCQVHEDFPSSLASTCMRSS
jgi:hypothetical protein